ncbi:MAG TPA: hypothetical protein ENI44_02780, partial [Thermoplasmatales archaeon]|nr:hypothetical protein [Thermoplasmatales archaeon]
SNNSYTLCLSNAKYNTIVNNSFSYDTPGDGIRIAYDSIGYSEENIFYLNNFYFSADSIFMQGPGQSDKHNNWNSTNPLNYTYNGSSYYGHLGNYWSEQFEKWDSDGNGVADEGYEYIINYNNTDEYPLMEIKDFYTINSEKDVTPPTITISSPEWEHTYTTRIVWLNVSADEDIDTWWYNLDDNGNITFIPNITLNNLDDGYHAIIVYANDTAGNIGSSTVGFMVDATPPKSISNLSHTVGMTWINWTWDNPNDEDFSCVELYINGTYESCTTREYLNKTGLQPSTEYTLSTRTRDIAGNYNETWINDTATTENQPSDVLYVNTSGWWFSNGLFHPSSTPIQSAIDNALDNCSIFIYNGSYDGSILVDKRLNITGMGNVTITVSDPSEDYGIKLTDDHISLGYIRLNISVGYRGIWLDYVSNCRIFNVTVNINSTEGDTIDGIYLDNSQDNIIENTSVNSQGFQSTGIYNYYSDGTIIRNNTVYVNGDSADGIEVFNSYASVIGNTINISGISSNEGYGVYLYLPYNSTIENNIIMINLSESKSWNAYFIGGSDCIFRDNILSGVNASIDRLDEDIIKIRGVPRDQWPSNPENHVNISIFLDISMEYNNWLTLNITYNESELPSNLIS